MKTMKTMKTMKALPYPDTPEYSIRHEATRVRAVFHEKLCIALKNNGNDLLTLYLLTENSKVQISKQELAEFAVDDIPTIVEKIGSKIEGNKTLNGYFLIKGFAKFVSKLEES